MIRFRILGPVEVSAEGGLVLVAGRRQLKLLAFLLLHANRAVSSDALIDAVWGAARAGSDNRLQMALTRLRKALLPLNGGGEHVLRTVGGGYLLSVGEDELDAGVFAALVAEGRQALSDGEFAGAGTLLREALGLWRGPPLAEVAYENFAQGEIRRLEELRLVALEARIDTDLRLARSAELVGELERLVAEQPTRERFAAQLMLALYGAGRQADALEVYQRVRTRLSEELGIEPGPGLTSLHSEILLQGESLPAAGAINLRAAPASSRELGLPLPLPNSSLIGREQELDEMSVLATRPDVRLVTLTGPAGVGKTRLALAVAHRIESLFSDGACWIELAGVARCEDVGSTLVRALAVSLLPGEKAIEALRRYLGTTELLLVIDNFEHVIEASGLVADLHRACPRLTIIVTSREALNLNAEHQYPLAPLPLPSRPAVATMAEIESAAATAMFLAAVRRRNARFAIGPETAPVIAGICARLDGLPLAMELAAARTTLLGVAGLAAALDRALAEPGAGARDAPSRHQTVEAAIDWSYRLLGQEQRAAFARLAVFAGGATVSAAEAVTASPLATLEELNAKSMIEHREQPDGSRRLVMLETVRRYALERLVVDPAYDATRRRHLEYYLLLVEQNAPEISTRERDVLSVLDVEIDNIRGAIRWALESAPGHALRLAGSLRHYWMIRPDTDALAWLDAALGSAGEQEPSRDRARALVGRAYEMGRRGQFEEALETGEAAVVLYQQINDHAGISEMCCELVIHAMFLGEIDKRDAFAQAACKHARLAGDNTLLARALTTLAPTLDPADRAPVLDQCTQLLSEIGDNDSIAKVYNNCAYTSLSEGRVPEALALLEVALRAAEQSASPGVIVVVGNLGLGNLLAGRTSTAAQAYRRYLELSMRQPLFSGIAEGLAGIAALFAVNGRPRAAALLRGASHAMGYPTTGERPVDDRLEREFLAPARERCGKSHWARAESDGEALSCESAIAYALRELVLALPSTPAGEAQGYRVSEPGRSADGALA